MGSDSTSVIFQNCRKEKVHICSSGVVFVPGVGHAGHDVVGRVGRMCKRRRSSKKV